MEVVRSPSCSSGAPDGSANPPVRTCRPRAVTRHGESSALQTQRTHWRTAPGCSPSGNAHPRARQDVQKKGAEEAGRSRWFRAREGNRGTHESALDKPRELEPGSRVDAERQGRPCGQARLMRRASRRGAFVQPLRPGGRQRPPHLRSRQPPHPQGGLQQTHHLHFGRGRAPVRRGLRPVPCGPVRI